MEVSGRNACLISTQPNTHTMTTQSERPSAPARHENPEQTDQAAPTGGGSGAAPCSAGEPFTADELRSYRLINWQANEATLVALEVAYTANNNCLDQTLFRQSLCRLIVCLEEQGKIPKGSLVPGTEEMRASLEEVIEYRSRLRPGLILATLEEACRLAARHKQWTCIQSGCATPENSQSRNAGQLSERELRCSCSFGGLVSENQAAVQQNDPN